MATEDQRIAAQIEECSESSSDDKIGLAQGDGEDERLGAEVYKSIVKHEYPFFKDERSEEEKLGDEVWYASRSSPLYLLPRGGGGGREWGNLH